MFPLVAVFSLSGNTWVALKHNFRHLGRMNLVSSSFFRRISLGGGLFLSAFALAACDKSPAAADAVAAGEDQPDSEKAEQADEHTPN